VRETKRHSLEIMNLQRGQPKRVHSRFPFATELEASQLSPAGKPRPSAKLLRARIENISTGGLCIRAPRPLESAALVRCGLRLPGIPVSIPLLAKVCWTEKRAGTNQYRIGLQFVV
jgi:PilZ domain